MQGDDGHQLQPDLKKQGKPRTTWSQTILMWVWPYLSSTGWFPEIREDNFNRRDPNLLNVFLEAWHMNAFDWTIHDPADCLPLLLAER